MRVHAARELGIPQTKRGRRTAYAATAVCAVFIAIQFVPVHRVSRAGSGEPAASPEVKWILRRACYDCHSTESRWPIWGYVAPASWLVVRDVDRARAKLNFSDWPSYSAERQTGLRFTIGALAQTHKMPLWYYVTMHPDAKLSHQEVLMLLAWAQQPGSDSSSTK